MAGVGYFDDSSIPYDPIFDEKNSTAVEQRLVCLRVLLLCILPHLRSCTLRSEPCVCHVTFAALRALCDEKGGSQVMSQTVPLDKLNRLGTSKYSRLRFPSARLTFPLLLLPLPSPPGIGAHICICIHARLHMVGSNCWPKPAVTVSKTVCVSPMFETSRGRSRLS